MDTPKKHSTWWIVGAILGAMLCCLILGSSSLMASILLIYRSTPTPTVAAEIPPATPAPPLTIEVESSLLALTEMDVPIADPVALAERLRGLENVPRILATSAAPIPVGTIQTFWVGNNDENTNFQVDAEMVYATDHVYIWIERGVAYDLQEVKDLADDFEGNTYPTVREFFGSEWTPGIDGDPHLYILFANGLGGTVAGYFGSNDELSPEVHMYSNGHEMFYVAADMPLTHDFTRGVLAHEFQHMIHWYRDMNETTWMNEGCSELASLLTGHDVGGHDFSFVEQPDITLDYWPSSGEETFGHYGQAFLYMSYILGRLGPEVTQALVANPSNGLVSIDETLQEMELSNPETGAALSADDLYLDFAAALLLQDRTLDNGRYFIEPYPYTTPTAIVDKFRSCPVAEQARTVSQYGIDYIEISCPGQHTLSFQGTSVAQVVPTAPHSGDYAFWSNRGDHSDMTLQRSFDLRGVETPITLSYWTWYDIEDGWDYVYLLASEDGGDTWEILTTPSGTDENPSGNSFGWGYTGFSGGGAQPTWIQETVDLSRYAGKQVMLRFEYITDAAVNGEGFLLDDLQINAIDYAEDFEQGNGAWEDAGFIRLYNLLPQTYRLQLVEFGSRVRVREIPLDDQNHAEVLLNEEGDVSRSVLIVIGTARYTWQSAPYRIRIEP
jgi:immune inhibitor A